MLSKKTLLSIAFCAALFSCGLATTYSYFVYNQKLENGIHVSMGDIKAGLVKINENTPITGAVVNIGNLMPGKEEAREFSIQNTGTLTSKAAIYLGDFRESVPDTLLPYLNYKIKIGSKVYEGNLKEYSLCGDSKYILIKDNSGNPILLKPQEKINVTLTFGLSSTASYKAEGKSIKFNLFVISTQPNDPQWIRSE